MIKWFSRFIDAVKGHRKSLEGYKRTIDTYNDILVNYADILNQYEETTANLIDECRKVQKFNRNLTDLVNKLRNDRNKVLQVKVKYFDPDLPKLKKINQGDWIDLRAAETVALKQGDYKVIPLGVGMILPDGYEALILPRSSTSKTYGVIMACSTGVIDNSYSGDGDQWCFPVFATRDTVINKGDRIAQFRLVENMNPLIIEEVEHLNYISRGGFGSTGVD